MLWIETAEHFRLWFYYALFIPGTAKTGAPVAPPLGELASLRDA